MKNINKLAYLTLLSTLPFFVGAQQNYDTDTFENYVADQEVQESLNNAQEVLCQIANMGTKELANDGAFKATQSKTLCSTSIYQRHFHLKAHEFHQNEFEKTHRHWP